MKRRLIGAIFVLIIAIPMYLIGNYYFKVLNGIIAILAYKELVFLDKYPKIPVIIGLISLLSIIYFNNNISYLLLCTLLIPILFYKDYNSDKAFKMIGISLLLGIAFKSFDIYMIVNKHILLYLVIVTVFNDTFAYLIGSKFGKHKFSKISPNKTIEGLIGGMVFGLVFSMLYYMKVINPEVSFIYLLLITIILNIAVITGDIMFSKIKREHNIKDYSKLIPGHGGILDRLDSLILTSIVYMIITMI